MSTLAPARLAPYLDTAVRRVRKAARAAAERAVDSLGLAASSAANVRQRDAILAAQFELRRKLATFTLTFDETLDRKVERAFKARNSSDPPTTTDWASLTLVDDQEVENQVSADRLAAEIQDQCEWEIRELDAYIGSLLGIGHADHSRNPLRPEAVSQSLVRAIASVTTERPESRKVMAAEINRSLAPSMRQTYASIISDLRSAGVKPVGMATRTSDGPGYQSGHYQSGYDRMADAAHGSGAIGLHTSGYSSGFIDDQTGRSTPGGHFSDAAAAGRSLGQIDAGLMNLMRRLAYMGSGDSGFGSISNARRTALVAGDDYAPLPNVIVAHRDELRRAATGTIDHMVIDLVGSLFDQILSDPKVAPQMARQIARLQLPVLRTALGDTAFFSSQSHPVRRFVNRIASLGAAYDDFDADEAKAFLKLVKELVQDVVQGDFDQIELYEKKLQALEAFITDQTRRDIHARGAADELLARKEAEAHTRHQYSTQLQGALQSVPVDEFVRNFLIGTWSQVVLKTAEQGGPNSDATTRARNVGRDLVMSVQPKGTPQLRKAFLLSLPQLMKDLNAGMDLIGFTASQRKDFFDQLLPAHGESLKGKSQRILEYNLLAKEVDEILSAPLPKAADLPPSALPELRNVVTPASFSTEEAEAIGLIDETKFNWDGKVDIDLGAEPEVNAADTHIEGLPAAESIEPSRGKSLAEYVQIGFAYQMHLDDGWHKVRLAHMSPGRGFFVFTRGGRHKRTISMTYRMLARLCETGRLRAFENAYLLERAIVRTRRQLARLTPGATGH